MELGNMIFGNRRGQHAVNRDLQDEFCEALEGMGFDGYGNHKANQEWVFENDTFRMQPYYWGDCGCGFDQRDSQWSEDHQHAPECYQTELRGRTEAWEIATGYKAIENKAFGLEEGPFKGFDVEQETLESGVFATTMVPRSDAAMAAWRKASAARENGLRKLYAELSAKYGVDPKYGVAVHCTCSYESDYQSWREVNDHASSCFVVTPNFLFKPTGFRLDWYKYPLRDSYSSEKLTRGLMRKMLAACAESLRVPQEAAGAKSPAVVAQ